MRTYHVSEAQVLTKMALESQDSATGKAYEQIITAIQEAAKQGKRSATFNDGDYQLNVDQRKAVRSKLEEGGFKVAYHSSYQGSYITVDWTKP